MAKPQVYINVGQVLAIVAAGVVGVHYLNIQRDAVGIQKTQFKDRIMQDAGKVIGVFVAPFRHIL